MGFTISYRSVRLVSPAASTAVRNAAAAANVGRTWLSCEPVHFFPDEDGRLVGASKPNLSPHPDDMAAAAKSGLPDGTTDDLLDILCQLSRQHGVDWIISHDHDPEVGRIRNGVCDEKVTALMTTFGALGGLLGDLGLDGDF